MRLKAESLLPGTQYAVQVRAVRDGQYSEFSERFIFTTDQDTTAPDVPTGVTWTSVGDSFVATWTPVTTDIAGDVINVGAYEVELVAGIYTKYVVAPAQTGSTQTYTLAFADNMSLFPTPQPNINMRVRAVSVGGVKGAFSGSLNATNPPPGPPTSPSTVAGVDTLNVAWTAPTDSDLIGYNVYAGTTAGFTPGSGNKVWSGDATRFSYTSTTYTLQYFKIRAVDKFLQESTDAVTSGTPVSPFTVDLTAPATPTSLSATITNNGNGVGATAAVTWAMASPPSDLAGYNLRFRAVSTTNYQYMNGIDPGVLAAQVLYLNAYTNYEFQIQAYDFSNNKSAWSATYTAVSPTNATPAAPTGLTSTSDSNSITYNWTGVADTDIKNYEVTFSTSSTFASGNITYLTGTATNLTVSGLTPATTYYARVRANDNGGLSSAFTATNTKATAGTPGASDGIVPGTGTTPSVLSGLSYLYATWAPVTTNASAGAQVDTVTYEVHLSTTTGFTPSAGTKVDEVSGTSMVIDHLPSTTTPLSYGTTYFVKIVPKDRDGSGAASAQGSGSISKVASTDVTSIGADLIVPGSGFITNLIIGTGGSIQSSDYSPGVAGFKLNSTGGLELSTGSVKASVITAGTWGSSTGVIQIQAGAVLQLNGGYMRSNTYTGTSAASNPSGAGFYLGNDGLRIDQGTISAAALATSNLSSATITLTGSGAITASGWTLNSSGLSIPNGAINAAALNIQNGNNLIPPQYADFEFNSAYYDTTLAYVAGTGVIDTTDKYFNSQSLKWTTSATSNALDLSSSQTVDNFIISPNTTYIISAYVLNKSTGPAVPSLSAIIRHAGSGGRLTVSPVASVSVTNNNAWARYSWIINIGSTATGAAHLAFTHGVSGAVLWIDGIQVEEKLSNSTTPSTWKPPGSTNISGDMIRTGSIISSGTTVVNSLTIPWWNINANGAASFANLQVRGNAVVGVANSDDGGASQIASGNYVAGQQGWIIRSDGYAELRQLAADSIDGSAIKAQTLTADTITAGTLNDQIALGTGTSLVATGQMGEIVGLGDYGFMVNGPQQNTVTLKASSAFTRTLTTSVPHNFYAPDGLGNPGSKVNIVINDVNYDTPDGSTDYVVTVPSPTTFTYTRATSLTDAGTSVTGGIVQGSNPDLVASSPVYISFPTDGTQPNIISGQMTADDVTITEGMSIRKGSQIEQGAVLTINSVIQPPHAAPTISQSYSGTGMATDTTVVAGIARGPNGNFYLSAVYPSGVGSVDEYDSNGRKIASHGNLTPARYLGSITGGAVVYGNVAGGRWYVHYIDVDNNSNILDKVKVYDTSWNQLADYIFASSTSSNLYGTIGWDFTNNRLMLAYSNTSTGFVNVKYFTLDGSGVPTGLTSATTTTVKTYTSSPADSTVVNFVARGDFDYGAGSDVMIFTSGYASQYGSSMLFSSQYCVTNNAGAQDYGKNWPVANDMNIRGAVWDTVTSKFVDINTYGTRRTYEGGDSYWNSTAMASARWAAYSWYRSTGTPAETTCSPLKSFLLSKRARLSITIAPVPTGVSGTLPDSARIYVLGNGGGVFPTNYYLRATVPSTSTTANIDPYTINTAVTPHMTNDFNALAGTPGQILSATGQSFWKGDDTAQFKQLVLVADSDANSSAGNKPALRIGDPTGWHLRIDNNEIIAMTGDTGQNTLSLNAGGTTSVNNITVGGNISSTTGSQDIITTNGAIRVAGGANVSGKVSTNFASATGVAMVLDTNRIVVAVQAYNSTSPTTSNTAPLYAAEIHSMVNGLFMDDLSGGGTTGASIGNGGRIIRTSTKTMKEKIKPMTDSEALSVLGLESYTFEFKKNLEYPNQSKDPRRYPGFIAEQAAEAGAELWVGRQHKVERNEKTGKLKITRDKNGEIIYFRTGEVTVAHNHIIKNHHSRIEDLEAEVARLREILDSRT